MSLANPIEAQQQSEYEAKPICGAPRGQKRPFRPREVWAIRARLEMLGNARNLALLNLAIDSKLRGCDLVSFKVLTYFPPDRSESVRW